MPKPSSVPIWFQKLAAGLLLTPQKLMQAVRAETPAPDRFFGKPDDTLHFSAPARLARAQHFYSTPHLKQWDRADWQGVDPRIAIFAAAFLKRLQQMGVPFYCHTAYRTRAEQDAAYARGNSRLNGDRTAHRVGGAVDLVHGLFHWELSRQEWDFIGKVGKDVHAKIMRDTPKDKRWEIVWGGDWKNPWDPAHWELKDWRSLPTVDEHFPIKQTPTAILKRYCLK